MAKSSGSSKGHKSRTQTAQDTRIENMDEDTRKTLMNELRSFVRSKGETFLNDPNITSIGIGVKPSENSKDSAGNLPSSQICIQFTAGSKIETEASIEALGSKPINQEIINMINRD